MSDSIRFQSDGVVLELADGRTVRPIIEDPETEKKMLATQVSPIDEYAFFGEDLGEEKAILWFEEEDDE